MTDNAYAAAKLIQEKIGDCVPTTGLILGSGLGAVTENIKNSHCFLFQDLPGFPDCRVASHKGQLVVGYLNGVPIACLQGRGHFYEGCESAQILTYLRTLKLLGCHTVIITGAVGSLRQDIPSGQLVMLNDHINAQGRNPLVGVNDDTFGTRFPDMSAAYDVVLREKMRSSAQALSVSLKEGVYISVLGPSFETPAEIRAFSQLGADVIGMSVVPEVIAARHCNLRVVGLTVVTNAAAGLTDQPLTHEETVTTAHAAAANATRLIEHFVTQNA